MENQTTLYQGDCLEILQEIPPGSVDMVLCDLPYGITACKWDSVIPFPPLWEQYWRITKEHSPVVLFAAQPFTTALIASGRPHFRYCWYWKKNNKTGGTFAKVQPMRCIEDIAVFYKKAPTYNPQGLRKLSAPKINKQVKDSIYGGDNRKPSLQEYTGYPHHLLEFNNDAMGRNRLHPTQKPVPLLEYLVKTYTNEGDTVLDNCMGSGSTGVACIRTGRKFIGIEKDPQYFQVAQDRLDTEAAYKALAEAANSAEPAQEAETTRKEKPAYKALAEAGRQ